MKKWTRVKALTPEEDAQQMLDALKAKNSIYELTKLPLKKPSYADHGVYMNYMRAKYKNQLGDKGWQEIEDDRIKYEEQRDRAFIALQSSYKMRYQFADEPNLYPVPETEGYTPQIAERVDLDPNINSSERDTLRFVVRTAFRQARETRTLYITVGFIAKGLRKSIRQIRRHLRALERAGYIKAAVTQSTISRMAVCLRISLQEGIFPFFHRKRWPARYDETRGNRVRTFSSDKELNKYYTTLDSVRVWARRCLIGVSNSLLQTRPHLLKPG